MIKKIYTLLLSCLILFANAQAGEAMAAEPQMADIFRQDGKIYVVIAVIAIVFLFVVGMLIYMERKLNRLEKKINERIK